MTHNHSGELELFLDVYSPAGVLQGSGPAAEVISWNYSPVLDGAGTFRAEIAATEEQISYLSPRNSVICKAWDGNTWVEYGSGIIDRIVAKPGPDGATLEISGSDMARELTFRSVGMLQLDDGSGGGISHSSAVSSVGGYAPSGWTFNPDVAGLTVYGAFSGETVLDAIRKLAEISYSHFALTASREITFLSTFEDSGWVALDPGETLGANQAAITGLEVTAESFDIISRIYPYGAGQGNARLTLGPCTISVFSPYSLDTTNNYLKHSTAETTYGQIERYVQFPEVAPISNTDADLETAANTLYVLAKRYLDDHIAPITEYRVDLAGCTDVLLPGQTIRVLFWDPGTGVNINGELNILESSISVGTDGVRTTSIRASTGTKRIPTDGEIIVSDMARNTIYKAHPQLNANSYTTAYSKNVDADENATIYFRLGEEVAQVNQIAFDFQLLPFESSVRSIAAPGTTGGSGELNTNAYTGSSGIPSNDTSGTPSDNTSGPSSGNTLGPSTTNTGNATGNTGNATGNTGPSSGSTATPSTPNTGTASGDTGGSGTLTTGTPYGGDIASAGRHYHSLQLKRASFSSGWQALYFDPSDFRIYALDAAGGTWTTSTAVVDPYGNHYHDTSTHVHDLNSHTHSLNSHSHSLNAHTHDLNSHYHSMNNHYHSLNSHAHSLNGHTHSLGGHTHDLSNHTHSLNDHKHSFDIRVAAEWGIYRDSAANTCDTTDLEFSVNGGSWTDLDGAVTSLGGDWYRLDVTADVTDPDTYRPLQAANTIEFRQKTGATMTTFLTIGHFGGECQAVLNGVTIQPEVGDRIEIVDPSNETSEDGIHTITARSVVGGLGSSVYWNSHSPDGYDISVGSVYMRAAKLVTIDGLLSVRNIIQAIAYT